MSRTTEWALLLACARPDEPPARSLRQIAEAGVDWRRVFELAAHHGVVAPVAQRLETDLADALPPEWLERFRRQRTAHAWRNLVAARALLHLLHGLDRYGIQAIPFKGPVLAQMAYGNLSARQFGDLDLWAPRQDFPRAGDALRELGYWTSGKVYGSEVQFGRPDGWVVVDLHWSLTVPQLAPLLDEARIGNDLYPVQVAGQPVFTLAPADMLLTVCVHGLKDGWPKLKTVRDVAALAQRPDLDWSGLLARCREHGSLRTLLLGLVLAQAMLDAALPETVQEAIDRDPVLEVLAARMGQRLRGEGLPDASPVWSAWRTARLHLAALTRPSHRLHYLRRLLGDLVTPNERDGAAFPLPERLAWARRPLRPLRLIWEYGPGALHVTRGR